MQVTVRPLIVAEILTYPECGTECARRLEAAFKRHIDSDAEWKNVNRFGDHFVFAMPRNEQAAKAVRAPIRTGSADQELE